jgi:hypothetical protein
LTQKRLKSNERRPIGAQSQGNCKDAGLQKNRNLVRIRQEFDQGRQRAVILTTLRLFEMDAWE